jgi:hypothetical protein
MKEKCNQSPLLLHKAVEGSYPKSSHRIVTGTAKTITTLFFLLVFASTSWAQRTIPFTVQNNSPFNDNELYVACVGKDLNTNNHMWINLKTNAILPMDKSYNTVPGPTPNGDMGPGLDGKYANCFTRLSEIPGKTFNLPPIKGCRVFIAKGQQLYLYFHGAQEAGGGYAAPNHLNPVDPNNGILFEIIELTNDKYGFFGNHSRVDAFKYPMGMELFGDNGYQKKVGELKKYDEIIALYKANVPSEFQGTVSNAGEIWAPSKTTSFLSGANVNYFNSYIDAIWNKYRNVDLIFFAGDAGVFKGRVQADGRLVVVGQSGGFTGRTGIIPGKPTTQEVLEGKGVLDRRVGDGDLDLVIQSQLCAAINRHVVDITTANPGQQNFYNVSQFYKANPMNHYAKFWHLPGISIDQLAYGFCYDDVADQSPSLHTPTPTKVIAVFGGYAGAPNNNCPITPFITVNSGPWQSTTSVSVAVGNNVQIAPHPLNVGSWSWTGPNGFTSSSRVVTRNNIQSNQGGTYTAKYSNNGCTSTLSFTINVGGGSGFKLKVEAENYVSSSGVIKETCSEGTQNIGSFDAGDWTAYSITIPTAGTYKVTYRVASIHSGRILRLEKDAGTTLLGTVTIPNTTHWQKWTNVSHTVTLPAGTYDVGLATTTGGLNLNYFEINSNLAARSVVEIAPEIDIDERFTATGSPNPFEGDTKITVNLPQSGHTKVNVLNVNGCEIGKLHNGYLDAGVHEFEFKSGNLPTGMYVCTIIQRGKTKMVRIVKNK